MNAGGGWDVINTGEWGAVTKTDRIVFGPGIDPEDVRVTRNYDDLVLSIVGTVGWAHRPGLLLG